MAVNRIQLDTNVQYTEESSVKCHRVCMLSGHTNRCYMGRSANFNVYPRLCKYNKPRERSSNPQPGKTGVLKGTQFKQAKVMKLVRNKLRVESVAEMLG